MQLQDHKTVLTHRNWSRQIVIVCATMALAIGLFTVWSSHTKNVGATTLKSHAIDSYIVITGKEDGIIGEGATGGTGDTALNSFSWGVTNSHTNSSGAGAGKVSYSEMIISKSIDKASPQFFKVCAIGTHLKTAQIYFQPTLSGGSGDSMEIDFVNLLVNSVQWSASSNSSTRPVETISFSFQSYKIKYTPGSLGTSPV